MWAEPLEGFRTERVEIEKELEAGSLSKTSIRLLMSRLQQLKSSELSVQKDMENADRVDARQAAEYDPRNDY